MNNISIETCPLSILKIFFYTTRMSSWNPLDKFWNVIYPAFNPRPEASPSGFTKPGQIWDLPSPYAAVSHPSNQGAIPHFVNPGYFEKLSMIPEHDVVHSDPPAWMITANLGMFDWLVRIPAVGATGPAFVYAMSLSKKVKAPAYSLFSTAVIGLATGFAVAYTESESRLQGYLENKDDVEFWKKRAENDRLILEGKRDPTEDMSAVQKSVHALLGPVKVDVEAAETAYYSHKDSE